MRATEAERSIDGGEPQAAVQFAVSAWRLGLALAAVCARLAANVLRNQAAIWSFPRLLVRGKRWRPTVLFLSVTGLLFLIDPRDPVYFRHTQAFATFNLIVSGNHAALAMWVVMISAFFLSLVRRDAYLRGTFLLAAEAILSSELFTQVVKGFDRRLRPEDALHASGFAATWFQDKGVWYGGHGSFPSGHMIAAISIATVFAVRYRRHRWAPWTAYGLAAVVGFSRITLLSHFPSDVFAATVFGYVIAKYLVLRTPLHEAAPESPGIAETRVRVQALG